jgi:hypothetical protein
MKKITFYLVFLISSIPSYSQDSVAVIKYKPIIKHFTAEVNFNPFSSAPISINYLRFRKFVSERQAVRLGLSIGFRNQKQIENVTQSSFEISLRPGYEWHFVGTDRLSPYIGLDGDFTIKSSSFSDDRDAATSGPIKGVKGAWDSNGSERGFTRLGANILVGADYYLVRKLYLGLEFGYGFLLINTADITTTFFTGSASQTVKEGSTFQIGPNFNSSLRLGFIF